MGETERKQSAIQGQDKHSMVILHHFFFFFFKETTDRYSCLFSVCIYFMFLVKANV